MENLETYMPKPPEQTPPPTEVIQDVMSAEHAEGLIGRTILASEVAVHGLTAGVARIRAGLAEHRLTKLERQIEFTEYKHDLVNGNAGQSDFDVSTMNWRERRKALKAIRKAADAKRSHSEAKGIEAANGGLGRIPNINIPVVHGRKTKRSARKDVEKLAFTGQIEPRDMHFSKASIKLGGPIMIEGQQYTIEGSKPTRRVERAKKRAHKADKRAGIVINTNRKERRADRAERRSRKQRQRAEAHRQARLEASKRRADAKRARNEARHPSEVVPPTEEVLDS